jgi:hypothetical protein
VHNNEHQNPENYFKNIYIIPFFEHTFKVDRSKWNATYNMHEMQINIIYIYIWYDIIMDT